MADLLHELVLDSAYKTPHATALAYEGQSHDYAAVAARVESFSQALMNLGMQAGERAGVYLEKCAETVISLYGIAAAGGAMVPINPLLKPAQVLHIIDDAQIRILTTSAERYRYLAPWLQHSSHLRTVIIVGDDNDLPVISHIEVVLWKELPIGLAMHTCHRRIDSDMAAILYTSGSTGKPKGVVLSHRNLVAGAKSVTSYLDNSPHDRILALLPLSFDYGLSQLSTGFYVGATVVLMNYYLPQEVVHVVSKERITGLAGVPTLWGQLARQKWPDPHFLRYITNSGGRMPRAVLDQLRQRLSHTKCYLMYGLTEAFRSTYLPPNELDARPDSIGIPIPNTDIMVVRSDGTPCDVNEPGELVHRGPMVALGYWNDPIKTAERFRPAPLQPVGLPLAEMAVWSGDIVRQDEQGYLYFIGRSDEMMKVSGYRISPTEIEEVLMETAGVAEAAVFGISANNGEEKIAAVVFVTDETMTAARLLHSCRLALPSYMVPSHINIRTQALPRNPNGKLDRRMLKDTLLDDAEAECYT